MAYVKTVWEAREGENLDLYTKQNETSATVILINTPSSINVPGTPFNPPNMNKIEQGVFDAHELIAEETQQRQNLQTALQAEVQERDGEDRALRAALQAEEQARETGDRGLQEQINTLQDVSDIFEAGGSFSELFAAKQDKITATGSTNVLTAPETLGGQPGTKAVSEFATAADVASKAPVNNPVFTGIPQVPSKASAAANLPTRIATEAQVALKADKNAVVQINNGEGHTCGMYILDNLRTWGVYSGAFLSSPVAGDVWVSENCYAADGFCVVFQNASRYLLTQIFIPRDSTLIYHRKTTSPSSWGPWQSTANTESPVFAGAPKIRDANGSENRIAVVAAASAAGETNLPVGSYISVNISDYPAGNANTQMAPRLQAGNYSTSPYGTPLSGTWRSCGSNGNLCRRVA